MKAHAALALALANRGVSPLFGVIGDANMFAVDVFVRDHAGNYVAAANEAGAILMAIGHAQVSGGVGVATVTHGPGLTNGVTALAEGVKARVPMVLLAGDTPTINRAHLQNIDQRELVHAAGAGFIQLRSPHTIGEDLGLAFRTARLEHRPVVLNMPADFQWEETTLTADGGEYVNRSLAFTPAGEELDNAIGIIAAARAPIVLAGRGAMAAPQRAAIISLAKRIGAPLATTLRGRDLFRGEAFDLGIFGTLSTPPAVEAISASDCVISFGASLSPHTTVKGALLKGKRVVQVDSQRTELGRNVRPDAALVGDPALVANLMIEWLDTAEIPPSGFRTDELAGKLANWRPEPLYSKTVPEGAIDVRAALRALSDAIPADRMVATDAGRFLGEAWSAFPVMRPSDLIYTVGFGSIGIGLAEAIGAAAADRKRPTVAITGDGGFMLGGLAEFNTAVRHRCDLIVIVCNDGAYGSEYVQFTDRNLDPSISVIEWPDLAPIAIALGGEGVTIRHARDLPAAAAAIAGRTRPLLVDVKLHPDHIPQLPR